MNMENHKPRLAISFSGGRTSAVMTKLCLEKYGKTHDIIVTFANTGCEHPNTLQFIKDCDDNFGFGTVWLEAVVNPEQGKGITAKVVTFETASRNGEPFEAAIAKYGIPGPSHPQCTSRLKTEVMYDYLRSRGWKKGSYVTAIGIRADEPRRISATAQEQGFIYPLFEEGYNKQMVKAICAKWEFDLKLPGEHYGNCTWCWKKSQRKLLTIAKHTPEVFDFPKRMEELYSRIKQTDGDEDRRFFRNRLSATDILNLAQEPFDEYSDDIQMSIWDFMDCESGCGESCEIGTSEQDAAIAKIEQSPPTAVYPSRP